MMRIIPVVIFLLSSSLTIGQDLTGKWVGYLDQSIENDTLEGFEAYWETGEFTHHLELTLFQKGFIVKGLYEVDTRNNPDNFARFKLDGSFSGTVLHYNAQIKDAIGAAFCFNIAELIYIKRDGVEYLEGGDWKDKNKPIRRCASTRIFLKKVENIDSKISRFDISGVWKGYEDQTAAASKINVYQYNWEVGIWKKGEPTGVVELKLIQKGKMVTGDYYVYNSGDSSSYAIYKMKGWIEDSLFSVMSFEVEEHNYGSCEFWTKLTYSFKEGTEYLEGEGEALQRIFGYHVKCPTSVIFFEREKKITQSEDLYDSKPKTNSISLVTGAKITLDKVQFDQSSYAIREDAISELERITDWMNQHPNMVIQLEGHTDNQGIAKMNMKLSENRIKAIKEYLVNKGIKSKRIKIKAFGQTRPIASNKNPETRKFNRRVEMVVLEN